MKEKCKRCGLCCIITPCDIGEEDIDGSCKYLVTDENTYSCKLLLENEAVDNQIHLNLGCSLEGNKVKLLNMILPFRTKRPKGV